MVSRPVGGLESGWLVDIIMGNRKYPAQPAGTPVAAAAVSVDTQVLMSAFKSSTFQPLGRGSPRSLGSAAGACACLRGYVSVLVHTLNMHTRTDCEFKPCYLTANYSMSMELHLHSMECLRAFCTRAPRAHVLGLF